MTLKPLDLSQGQITPRISKRLRDGDGDGYVNDGKNPKRKELTPMQRAAVSGGVLGAAVASRRFANRTGIYVAGKTMKRSQFAAQRAASMKSATGASLRRGYARRLEGTSRGMNRSDDTREVTGRLTLASLGAGTAAGVSHVNRRMKENGL